MERPCTWIQHARGAIRRSENWDEAVAKPLMSTKCCYDAVATLMR